MYDSDSNQDLKSSLKPRHVQMMALGGVIGMGLFVGSSVVIQSAGPAAILSFLITGILIILVMRMLGELATASPVTGSFYAYARYAFQDSPFLSRLAGFMTGWMYWYFWVIVIALEAIVGAKLLAYWLPDIPQWIVSLVLLVLLTATNLFSVKSFGEFEFWFSSIKVAAIGVFIFLCSLYLFGFWPNHQASGLGELLKHGGFMPNGWIPVLSGAVAATGFYFGAEIVTIAAAETKNPEQSVAKATQSVITRVLLFYVCSIFLVVCLVPWNSPDITTPYVSALKVLNIPFVADIMNAVILVAVLSCLNSGVYAASRMLFALTKNGDAPRALTKLSKNGVPVRAILFSTLFGYISILASYFSPEGIFPFLVESYGTVALFVYIIIALSQIRLRRHLERVASERIKVRMWCFPYLSYVAIIGMVCIFAAMSLIPSLQKAFWFGIASAAILFCIFMIRDYVELLKLRNQHPKLDNLVPAKHNKI
ncbi:MULTISPECIES: amino acid permease [Acinetobacter]|uniref:amino acid permease n=1 Tax=Acinetobacter TaxID=469 RepID=UPI00097F7236|nr:MULTISPECIES: amino acid permease [Acinetobacter]MEB3796274.1 amino acid permease [Acinetobacter sp. IK24]MEB3815404.1 amino acid permease [Acinetobacter sp. IK22]MEB3834668.1 amino acid permease [Acinetobacter sp. IK23]MEB3838288.1 amino acid permease [Acinetobacter sp. IK25]ONN57851.1 GABA permease [Acinetobacter genomosp. 33YU]